jgi:uncharacterized membrane protein
MSHIIIAVVIGGIAVLYAVLFWFMPGLTRRDLYFAVTVAPGFRDKPAGKSILSRYRTELVIASALAFIAFFAGVAWFGIGFVTVGFLIQIAASFIAFYRARQRVLPEAVPPTMIREAELHGNQPIIPGGWIAASGPFFLLAGCAAYLWIHGAETATYYSSDWSDIGQPHRLDARSLSVRVTSAAAILVALSVLLYGLARWVRPIYAVGPERIHEVKFRRMVSILLLLVEYFIALQAAWIVLVRPQAGLRVALLPAGFLLVLIAAAAIARLGQGGNRMAAPNEKPSARSNVAVGDRTLDRYWKLGLFYFNRNDSAVIVEKRWGLGYGLNFARPTAWIIVMLVMLGVLIPILAHH